MPPLTSSPPLLPRLYLSVLCNKIIKEDSALHCGRERSPQTLETRIEEASPGDPGRFLLSSMVLIVTGEIPGPIIHCGRCHTLDTRALDDLMCSLPDVARCI